MFDIGTVFPLYLYANGDFPEADLFEHEDGRRPNLSKEFVEAFEQSLGLKFVPDGRGNLKRTFGPEDLFHFNDAVLHAPGYRERYADFLKCDFPHLPVTSQAGRAGSISTPASTSRGSQARSGSSASAATKSARSG